MIMMIMVMHLYQLIHISQKQIANEEKSPSHYQTIVKKKLN